MFPPAPHQPKTPVLSLRERVILWLVRKYAKRGLRDLILARWDWNSPPIGKRPYLRLVIFIEDEQKTELAGITMHPAQARSLCQIGEEAIDKQLGQWQQYWRENQRDTATEPDDHADTDV